MKTCHAEVVDDAVRVREEGEEEEEEPTFYSIETAHRHSYQGVGMGT